MKKHIFTRLFLFLAFFFLASAPVESKITWVTSIHIEIKLEFPNKAIAYDACVDFVASRGFGPTACNLGPYDEAFDSYNAGWMWEFFGVTTKPFYFISYYFPKTPKKGHCIETLMNGNPCNAATGNKSQAEIDYRSNTLYFTRYYNSIFYSSENLTIGKQWAHSYSAFLSISNSVITVHRPNGNKLIFKNENGVWISDAGTIETLSEDNLFFIYKTINDDLEFYNNLGQLIKITTRHDLTTHFIYNSENLLAQVVDPYEHAFYFFYDNSNRLIQLTTPDNTDIFYNYDVNNNLSTVVYPDDTPSDLSNNPRKLYHYEEANFPHHLTGITDENNIRYATWDYNNIGLVISSEHANGTEKVELIYNENYTDTTKVVDALGRIKTYTFETHYGTRKPKTIQYTYNDGQQLITKQKNITYYPETGRVKEIIDYNGQVTSYVYNNRGLITLETQAKGTLDEYTITTTWHPDYRLPATHTYPDRIETYTYNNQGQLINTQISGNP